MKKETKEFYTLKELLPFTELNYRALQNRIKIVCNKYPNRADILFKKYNMWNIHNSLIDEFEKEKIPIEYKLFTTIASGNNYNIPYWKFLLFGINKKLKQLDPSVRTKYVIELTKNNIYHLHFITTFDNSRTLKQLLRDDILTNSMNINIKEVTELVNLHKYLRKENKPILLK